MFLELRCNLLYCVCVDVTYPMIKGKKIAKHLHCLDVVITFISNSFDQGSHLWDTQHQNLCNNN